MMNMLCSFCMLFSYRLLRCFLDDEFINESYKALLSEPLVIHEPFMAKFVVDLACVAYVCHISALFQIVHFAAKLLFPRSLRGGRVKT